MQLKHTKAERYTVSCQTCDDLLAGWKCSARDYTNFVLNVSGVLGGDARLVFQEAERMARECKKTRDALMAHRCQEHGGKFLHATEASGIDLPVANVAHGLYDLPTPPKIR